MRVDAVGSSSLSYSLFYGARTLGEVATYQRSLRSANEYPHSHLVASAIIIWHAFLDAYINEWLALVLPRTKKSEDRGRLYGKLKQMKEASLGLGKLQALHGLVPQLDESLIADLAVFCDVRDLLYHFDGAMKPIKEYPRAASDFLERANVKTLPNIQWVGAICSIDSLNWTEKRIERFVRTFSELSGNWNHWSQETPPGYEEMWQNFNQGLWPAPPKDFSRK